MSFNVKVKTFNNFEDEIAIFKRSIHPIVATLTTKPKKEKSNPPDKERSKRNSLSRTKNMVYDIARSNHWEWFVTLTFNPDMVDSFNYSETSKKLSKWLNNIRRKCPQMVYIGVPELHESGRYHFHFLMSHIENMSFSDSGKKDKTGRTIFNIGNYSLGWSTSTKIDNSGKASNYITKYITKTMLEKTENKRRYWASKNIELPVINRYLLPPEDISDLKEALKEKTTSAKVVKINAPDFSNEIEYLQINHSLNC